MPARLTPQFRELPLSFNRRYTLEEDGSGRCVMKKLKPKSKISKIRLQKRREIRRLDKLEIARSRRRLGVQFYDHDRRTHDTSHVRMFVKAPKYLSLAPQNYADTIRFLDEVKKQAFLRKIQGRTGFKQMRNDLTGGCASTVRRIQPNSVLQRWKFPDGD